MELDFRAMKAHFSNYDCVPESVKSGVSTWRDIHDWFFWFGRFVPGYFNRLAEKIRTGK